MGKLFGTDGIRGVANRDLTPEMAFRIGRITASLLQSAGQQPVFLIGRDSRLSGEMLEGSLMAGITSAGAEAHLLGVVSTPAVAYLVKRLNAAAGVVISASHNPIEDNGLKIFNSHGLKLPDQLERRIEEIYFTGTDTLPRPVGTQVGRVRRDGRTVELYLDYLRERAPDLSGLKLVVDCGHGAACSLAPPLLRSLGAGVCLLHGEPDGSLINVRCGATDTADLQREVVQQGAYAGLAYDGDADRLIAVDEKGNVVDGDAIMAICATDMIEHGSLRNNTLVVTVMSNGGLDILAEKHGFHVVRTAVGDRYVLEKMLEGGYNLGGEQSGHIIFADRATTGDGLLTSLELLRVCRRREKPLSELASMITRLPQVLVNRKVSSTAGWQENAAIAAAMEETRRRIGRRGRLLVRPSGTEPLMRVMVEAPLPEDELSRIARELADFIAEELEKQKESH